MPETWGGQHHGGQSQQLVLSRAHGNIGLVAARRLCALPQPSSLLAAFTTDFGGSGPIGRGAAEPEGAAGSRQQAAAAPAPSGDRPGAARGRCTCCGARPGAAGTSRAGTERSSRPGPVPPRTHMAAAASPLPPGSSRLRSRCRRLLSARGGCCGAGEAPLLGMPAPRLASRSRPAASWQPRGLAARWGRGKKGKGRAKRWRLHRHGAVPENNKQGRAGLWPLPLTHGTG